MATSKFTVGETPPVARGGPPGKLAALNLEPPSKENPLTSSLAAMYPEAFAMAMRFYSRSSPAFKHSLNASLNSTISNDHLACQDDKAARVMAPHIGKRETQTKIKL
jgi:hypothetical protein